MDNHEQIFHALHQNDIAAARAYITQYKLYTYELLKWACGNEDEEIAELLTANYLVEDAQKETLLYDAIYEGDISVAKWLVKKLQIDTYI